MWISEDEKVAAVTVRSFLNGSRKLRTKESGSEYKKIGKAQLYAAPCGPGMGRGLCGSE